MYDACMTDTTDTAHIRRVSTWHSGGGISVDIVELEGGPTFVVADDTIAMYASADDFWAEVEDGGEQHRTLTLLREAG